MSKTNRKGFNVYVVEDHNEALFHIYRDIGAKKLNFTELTMIHFDSHPDLGIPADLKAEDAKNPAKLHEALSIESWILPAIFAGFLRTIVWIRPPWAEQIQTGRFDFKVGEDVRNRRIRCSCVETYFISDLLYANEKHLVNQRDCTLYVCDFEQVLEGKDSFLNEILTTIDPRSLILDIDLDFFSTQDPFKMMFADDKSFQVFNKVYATEVPIFQPDNEQFESDYAQFSENKRHKLDEIWSFIAKKETSRPPNLDLADFIQVLADEKGLDAEILHGYGSGMDTNSLPHHVSTLENISNMINNQMARFFETYFVNNLRPGTVTIARSSLDEYCPLTQVDFIQAETLKLLKSQFGEDSVAIQMKYE